MDKTAVSPDSTPDIDRNIHAFDLDGTLLSINSSFGFGAYLFKQGKLGFFTALRLSLFYIAHKLGLLSLERLHALCFRILFKGRPKQEFLKLAEGYIASAGSIFYKPAVDRLKEAKKRGDLVVILSNSPDFIVEVFAKHFGVNKCFGSVYATDRKDLFTHVKKICSGADKALILKSLASCREKVFTYSDSIYDIPFLEVSSNPTAVNPDRLLKRICKERSWAII